MITDVRIEGLRGIREGEIGGLGPLVVLVGPNGCGKSTVLDALHIGAGDPVEAIARAVGRRPHGWNGSRWLFSRQSPKREASVSVTAAHQQREAVCQLQWSEGASVEHQELISPMTSVLCMRQGDGGATVRFGADNQALSFGPLGRPAGFPAVRLVDDARASTRPLDELYTDAVEQGRKATADAALRAVLGPPLVGLTLLTDHRIPVVHLEYEDGSVPVSVAGDGVAALARIALELASRPGGTVLIEEPEAHQHPRLVWKTAELIWGAIARDVQIVLTTHSLELIDALIAAAPAGRLGDLGVYRLKIDDGVLHHTRIGGEDAAERRAEFEDDLR